MSGLGDAAALARYRQAALVGIGPDGAANLAPLAWLAARSRFARAPAPTFVEHGLWPYDARKILPEAARAPLRGLLTGKEARADGPYARRIARELRTRGLQPHPFDLKPLEDFVARQAGHLGRHAQTWLAIVRPAQAETREPYADEVEAITEASFSGASRGEKLAFLRGLRAHDPAAARAFMESRLDGEPANVRAGMISLLEVGLGADDAALLGRLAEDRAASVRDAATAMLARVPGTEAYAARKRDAAGWLELKSSGLLRRTRTIAVKRPATLPDDRLDAALAAAFEGVTLADMAAPFEMSLADFAVAARAEWRVARLVLARAVHEDLPDLVAAITQADGGGEDDTAVLVAALPALPPARRRAMVEAGLHPTRWTSLPQRHVLEALQDALAAPLPEATAAALLRGAVWAKTIERWAAADDPTAPDTIETMAALMPTQAAPAFLATLDPLAHGLKRRPRLLFDCLATFASSPGAAP